MSRAERKPDWRAVTYEALADPASLMRVLAGLGFKAYHGTVSRGSIRWWTPAYLTAPGNSPHRASYAEVNRAMRDADVHLVSEDRVVTAICSYQGEWRTVDGSQRGDDLASLGALRWGCRYGQAAGRITKLIGLDRVPVVQSCTSADAWAEVHANLREAAHA